MKAIHPSLPPSDEDLRVGVLNGVVHLAGMVLSLEIREKAEELCKTMGGLRGIVNRIEAPGAPSPARRIDINKENET